MIPTTKIVKLPRFLPHSRCTRRTDDSCSSLCAKSSDQRPPDTADRGRSASPECRSVRWRGSKKMTWSSIHHRPEPKRISTPPRTTPRPVADGCGLHRHLPRRWRSPSTLSSRTPRLAICYQQRRLPPLREAASNQVSMSLRGGR